MAAVVTAHASGCLGVALFEVDVASGEEPFIDFFILLIADAHFVILLWDLIHPMHTC